MLKKSFWQKLVVGFLGFFWAYSFSTRIGLFFVLPLWLKIILIGTLTINFSLLSWYLVNLLPYKSSKERRRILIIGSAILLITLLFVLVPYQRVPFRTTHQLTIKALDSDVKIIAIYSPDDNLISRETFEVEGGVEGFSEQGFRIQPGGGIQYSRPHTGKLTLVFSADSGPASITWDGTEQVLQPSGMHETGRANLNGWRVAFEAGANVISVELPGNTWGKPDLFWTMIGVLLPISDFISLASIIVFAAYFVIGVHFDRRLSLRPSRIVSYWLDAGVCIGLIVVLINVGFPDFIPVWFLITYLPVAMFLFYNQLGYLIQNGTLVWEGFARIDRTWMAVKKAIASLNRDQWFFWVAIVIVAMLGSLTQLYITNPGMIVSGDSVHYMNGAENLALGRGYVLTITTGDPVPITGFEPGYSMLLVPGIILGMKVQNAARFANALLLFITILLTGRIIFLTTRKALPALVGNLFLIMSLVTLSIYSFVMSEPLFIVLLLGAILGWFYHINNPTVWKAVLAGLIFTLMLNARLAGIVFLPVFVINILIFQNSRFGERLRDAFVFGSTALIAPAAFFIRNRLDTQSTANGDGLTLIPFLQEYWEVLGGEVSRWFMWHTYFNYDYQRFNAVFVNLGVILLLIIVWLAFRKKLVAEEKSDPIIVTLFISTLVYFASIILNAIFAVQTPTEGGFIRYMIPIWILLVILVSKLFSVYWKQPVLFPKIILLFIVLVGLQLYYTDYAAFLQKQPLVYRHYTDRKNECGIDVQDLISTMPNVAYYTNSCEYFYFLTGVQCRHLIFDEAAYQPGGEIHQALRSGDVLAFSEGFGSNPPGIEGFLQEMERFDTACYLDFYRLGE